MTLNGSEGSLPDISETVNGPKSPNTETTPDGIIAKEAPIPSTTNQEHLTVVDANQVIVENTDPKNPRIHRRFIFTSHENGVDFQVSDADFAKADIYALESVGWRLGARERMRAISDGTRSVSSLPLEKIGGFSHELFMKVANSHKPIMYIDLPDGHPIIADMERSVEKYVSRREQLFGLPVEERDETFIKQLIEMEREWVTDFARENKDREAYIISSFDERMTEMMQRYPQLAEKDNLNVLITFGSAHTGLYHHYARQDKESTTQQKEPNSTYDYFTQAIRAAMFDRPLDDELLLRALFSAEMLDEPSFYYASNLGIHTDGKITIFQRAVNERFTLAEVEELLKQAPATYSDRCDMADDAIAKRIELPKTAEEARTFK